MDTVAAVHAVDAVDMGASCFRSEGKTYLFAPVKGLISRSSSHACRESGTIWSRAIFMRAAGMHHSWLADFRVSDRSGLE